MHKPTTKERNAEMSRRPLHLRTTTAAAATLSAVALVGLGTFGSGLGSGGHAKPAVTAAPAVTSTPIKHVVVIFDENISFDHYFGTYPNAANTSGQPFYAAPGTPTVNGLTGSLLTANPNGVNPQRLDPANINDLLTCDQNHDYTPEQFAFDNGAMDHFTAAGGTATTTGMSPTGQSCTASDVMNYYDGNTVTAMWNYAQRFALNDNSFGTTFGPSAPGALNLVSGNTGGVDPAHSVRGALTDGDTVADGTGGYSLISDAQPYWDDCSNRDAVAMTGTNVGDLLNAKGLSWGWFEGGFTPNTPYTGSPDTASTYNQLNEPGRATCTQRTTWARPWVARASGVPKLITSLTTSPSSTTPPLPTRTTWRPRRSRWLVPTRPHRASSTPPTTSTTCPPSTAWWQPSRTGSWRPRTCPPSAS